MFNLKGLETQERSEMWLPVGSQWLKSPTWPLTWAELLMFSLQHELRFPSLHKIQNTTVLWCCWVKSKTQWWPRFAPITTCHSSRTTEDLQGLQKQITNPLRLRCFIKVSSTACLLCAAVCFLFVDHKACRTESVYGRGRECVAFHSSVGLDNKLVRGLPIPDALQVWQTAESCKMLMWFYCDFLTS